jgi:hypothetical protein
MLKVADETSIKRSYIITLPFSKEKLLITPETIQVQENENGELFCYAWVAKTLIFAQQVESVRINDQRFVQKLPTISIPKASTRKSRMESKK